MSNRNPWYDRPDDYEGPGYGEDIKYAISKDGTVDIQISAGGDIALVGGRVGDLYTQKRANAIQGIILRILTPLGAIKDEKGDESYYGSWLTTMVGEKSNELHKMVIKAYIMSCLVDCPDLEQVYAIDVTFPEFGIVQTTLRVKLVDDDQLADIPVTTS